MNMIISVRFKTNKTSGKPSFANMHITPDEPDPVWGRHEEP